MTAFAESTVLSLSHTITQSTVSLVLFRISKADKVLQTHLNDFFCSVDLMDMQDLLGQLRMGNRVFRVINTESSYGTLRL